MYLLILRKSCHGLFVLYGGDPGIATLLKRQVCRCQKEHNLSQRAFSAGTGRMSL